MRVVKLQKTFMSGTEYSTGLYDIFVIEKIGATSDIDIIKIDGREISSIDSTLQPAVRTQSNLFGPFDLKDLRLIVPPQKKFVFGTTAGASVYVEGKHIILDVGEGIPSELVSRFNEQDRVYYNRIVLSNTLPTNQSIAAGAKVLIGELKVPSDRRYVLDSIAGFSITNYSLTSGGVLAIQFELNGRLLDTETATYGPLGIDAFHMPLPPTMATNTKIFSFDDMPITLEPNYLLRVYAVNVSGSAISPPSNASLTLTFKAMARTFEL